MAVSASFSANFERNLEAIERFLLDTEAPQVFDALLDQLMDTVVPNLERSASPTSGGRSWIGPHARSRRVVASTTCSAS
jgi:uncharacterized protein with von Willebrand factor type A (vWA) domain